MAALAASAQTVSNWQTIGIDGTFKVWDAASGSNC
jgi:hypothetical protein